MGRAFVFAGYYVLLFLESIMETGSHITFVGTLLPVVGIVFLIAVGVIILTQQFRKNLYREQFEQEELSLIHI